MASILIQGATILTMAGPDHEIKDGELAIEGDRIISVGPRGSHPANYRIDRVINGSGMAVLPGLVNCHTHAAMTLMRSYADDMPLMKWLSEKIWPVEDKLEPEDIYWGTMLCCLEMIKSGTTTFADMYFFMDQAAAAVEESGLRACLSRGMIGSAPNAGQALEESIRLIKEWHGRAGGRIKVMLGPHAPYTCPPDYLSRVVKAAGENQVGIHIHVAETLDEIEQIKSSYGQTPVGYLHQAGLFDLPVLAAHCVHLDEADIEIFANNKVGVAHCPESNMKLASGIAPVVRLLEAGINVGLGTDGAASNNNLDLLEEMNCAALLQKVATGNPTVMPAFTALELATAGGAKTLGLDDEIGILEAGMKADMILVNLGRPHFYPAHNLIANLVYSSSSADVDTVIVDGKVIMEGRRVLTMDEEKVMWESQKRADQLFSKV
ncbi:MAG: 5-methylthioadenosine/S-adenosylhomocysteine deaminase [Pelotomaculum sp. PtaB.Bin104]|nr:MAG: 5-methylthioadenosine/S-adenosylhomocysteine deaminase [Pelotomaculum sp. PtaB.Bin104]